MKKNKIFVCFLIMIFLINALSIYSFADYPIITFFTNIYRALQILTTGFLVISVTIYGVLLIISSAMGEFLPQQVREFKDKFVFIIIAGVMLFSIQALIDFAYSIVVNWLE